MLPILLCPLKTSQLWMILMVPSRYIHLLSSFLKPYFILNFLKIELFVLFLVYYLLLFQTSLFHIVTLWLELASLFLSTRKSTLMMKSSFSLSLTLPLIIWSRITCNKRAWMCQLTPVILDINYWRRWVGKTRLVWVVVVMVFSLFFLLLSSSFVILFYSCSFLSKVNSIVTFINIHFEGIVDPIRINTNLGSLGVGKLAEDAEYTNAENIKRKALETEVELTTDQIKKRDVLINDSFLFVCRDWLGIGPSGERKGNQRRGGGNR